LRIVLDARIAELAVAQTRYGVIFIEALLRLGGRLDVPLDERGAERLGDFDCQHGLAGARLALYEKGPLQRDRGVDRDFKIVGGDVGIGTFKSHAHSARFLAEHENHARDRIKHGGLVAHNGITDSHSMKSTVTLATASACSRSVHVICWQALANGAARTPFDPRSCGPAARDNPRAGLCTRQIRKVQLHDTIARVVREKRGKRTLCKTLRNVVELPQALSEKSLPGGAFPARINVCRIATSRKRSVSAMIR